MNKRIYLSPTNYYYNDNFILSNGEVTYSEIEDDILTFEKTLQLYLETNKFCLALNSGTSALHISLQLAGVSTGDYVLCQSHTFVACANVILYQGAIPVFIDSEEETWNMSPVYLINALKDLHSKNIHPKALIAASLYGMPFQFDEVYAFAKAHNVIVIEDSAEALGSIYKNQKCGTLGDYGILSFNTNKIISSGGGGVLICKTKDDYLKALKIATQSKEKENHYHYKEIGYNYRIGHLNAKIGTSQIEILQKNIKGRQELNIWYENLFKRVQGIVVHNNRVNTITSNKWLTTILIDPLKTSGVTRENLRLGFAKENIESRLLWKPMHLQPLFENSLYYGERVSEDFFKNGLCLPSSPNLKFDEKCRIEKVIFDIFK